MSRYTPFTRNPRRAAGFTLMEVLVSIGIFTIGAVAVASIFPTAIFLQKQTVDDMELDQSAENAEAMISSRKFKIVPGGGFDTQYSTDAADNDSIQPVVNTGGSLFDVFSFRDRTYPSYYAATQSSSIWVPLIRDGDGAPTDATNRTWYLYAFVLQRRQDVDYSHGGAPPNYATGSFADYPSVAKVNITAFSSSAVLVDQFEVADGTINNLLLTPGVPILDSNGVTYTIENVDQSDGTKDIIQILGFIAGSPAPPAALWIADPGDGTRNPARRILLFTGDKTIDYTP